MPDYSKGERILQALLEALRDGVAGGPTPPVELTWHRNRLRPFTEDQLPTGVLYMSEPLGEIPTETTEPHETGIDGTEMHTLLVTVELRVEAVGDTPPETEVDPYLRYVVQTIHAASTLSGLLWSLPQRRSRRHGASESASGTFAGCGIDYEVKYMTSRGDPDN